MKQIVYVDVLFLLNFMMNFFLTAFTSFFRQKYPQVLRWLLASFLTAGISTGLIFLFYGNGMCLSLSMPLQIFLQIRLSFCWKGGKEFWKDIGSFVCLACFAGGVITAVFGTLQQGEKKIPVLWFLLAMGALGICLFGIRMECLTSFRRQKHLYRVRIFLREEVIVAKALYDTGNQLVSPYTGESVAIISAALANRLHGEKEKKQLIPFSSIGGRGLLEAFRVDVVEILETGEKREGVLVAISDSIKESSEIQMILNQ